MEERKDENEIRKNKKQKKNKIYETAIVNKAIATK